MPQRALTICRRCSGIATKGHLCEQHQQQAHQEELSRQKEPHQRLYRTAGWKATRAIVFARDPVCVVCLHMPSTECDHHPVDAATLVLQFGVSAFYDPARCRGTCKSCHSAKTRKEHR